MRDEAEHQSFVDGKRQRRMAVIDDLSPDVRALVHEYGWNVVNAFLTLGIQNPRHIRHLVQTVMDETSPTRGSFSAQGTQTPRIVRPPTVPMPRIDTSNAPFHAPDEN